MLFVSLGAWCQVAQQLKNHANDNFVSSAFDWTVSSLKSVPRIIESDGDNFCEGLTLSRPSNSLTCESYGILYHHEFKRDENNESFWTEETRDDAKSKLTHKHKSMSTRIRDTDECVTFVRFGGHAEPLVAWPYSKDHATVAENELNAIAESIEQQFPSLAFRILFVTCPTAHFFTVDERKLDPRIWTVQMRHRHGIDWSGSSDDWAGVMSRIPKTFARLTATSSRQEFPFADLEEYFDMLDLFSKEQIKAIETIIQRRIESSQREAWGDTF